MKSLEHKKTILLVCILTSFLNPFMGASVNIALPYISSEFSLRAVSMSWVAMAFLLASAIFLVPMGKLADIYGRKRIFLLGNGIFMIGSVLCVLSFSGAMLIIARVLQGIGAAMFFSTGMAILTSAFPPQERGKVIGYNVSAVYLGLSLAPVLGGFLTHAFGWRSLFLVTLPFSLYVICATLTRIKLEWADARNDSFDLKGSLIYMLSVTALMIGFSKLPDSRAIIATIIGLVGIVTFVRVEFKVEFPVLNMRLFRDNRVFAFSNLAALINYAATFAVSFILSLYLQIVKGFPANHAGMILVAQPLLMMVVSTISGRLSDKYDSRILASLGMSIIVVGLVLLFFITATTTNAYLIGCLLLLGIGFGLFSSPNTNSVMSSVEKKNLGIASATVSTMRITGQMLSMGISTLLIHVFIGEAKLSKLNSLPFLSSARMTFMVFSVLCIIGVFASLARGKKVRVAN
jgi:EmrB/QacA subfamily drug resistance transporter